MSGVGRFLRRARLSLKRRRELVEVVDMFCGAGGSSEGARLALEEDLGLSMSLACVNHSRTAIRTHRANHPKARHHRVNVYKLDPRTAVPSGELDLLMASPTCTFHSRSRGGKPISWDQRYGRMTPTQVLRWVTELDVRVLLVENVPEFVNWGPICQRTTACKAHGWEAPAGSRGLPRGKRPICGKPIAEKRGVYFRAWTRRIERLGYEVAFRTLNAADYGDATTRERFFLIARKDGEPIVWPEPTHSKDGSADLFGGGVKRWKPAAEVIDWSLEGRSIFDRERPLSRATLERIEAGARKFGWGAPFLVMLRNHMDGRPLDAPLPTICAGGTHAGLAEPVVFQVNQGKERRRNMRGVDSAPLQTVVTGDSLGLAQPVVARTGMHKSNALCVRGLDAPLATVTTDGGFALVEPFVLSQASGGAPRSTEDPVPTIPTDGAHALVEPVLMHRDASGRARPVDKPLPTVTGAKRGELAFVVGAFGERPGQAPRTRSIEKPIPTVCAKGRVPLVQGRERPYDILFRMLAPHELAAAMGFPVDYVFTGNKTQVVRQIGNAVAVGTARALVRAIFQATTRARRASARKLVPA